MALGKSIRDGRRGARRLVQGLALAALLAGCATTAPPPPVTQGPVVEKPATAAELEGAVALFASGDLAAAGERLRALRAADPRSPGAAFYLGRVYFAQERYADAVTALDAAVALDGSDVESWLWLGKALAEHVQRVPELVKLPLARRIQGVYEQAVALAPDRFEGHLALARYYSEAPALAGGDRDKAYAHARELLRISPLRGHLMLGSLNERYGRPKEAEAEYAAVLALDPDHAGAQAALARLRQQPPR